MLQVKVNAACRTLDKYTPYLSRFYGGVTYACLDKNKFCTHSTLRKNETNLIRLIQRTLCTKTANNSLETLHDSNQLLQIDKMPKKSIKYVATGKIWSFHDLLSQLANNHSLLQNNSVQFMQVQVQNDQPPKAKKKKSKKTSPRKAPNYGKAFMTHRVLTLEQIREFSTQPTTTAKTNKSLNQKQQKSSKLSTQSSEMVAELPRSMNRPTNEDGNLQKIFPQAKYSMNHVYITLAQHFADNSYQLSPKFKSIKQPQGRCIWQCTYSVKWPQTLEFSAVSATKQDASTKACLQGLEYLYTNKFITEKNLPILPGQEEEANRERQRIDPLILKPEVVNAMQGIVQDYESNMLQLLQVESDSDEGSEREIMETSENVWPIFNEQQRMPKFRGVEFYSCREGKILPISEYKEKIIKTINSHRVVIIKGEPGCGKSTRVPQYILEAWARDFQSGNADNCRIIVTQPRRIAAISLAERVASERAELPGSTVGYQVRLKSNFNRSSGKILYCTTGILLRRLQTDPSLTDCTHVIIDEAHERDVNTDLLLNLLKRALDLNTKLKLLVMSATIKAEVFQEYFDDPTEINLEELLNDSTNAQTNDVKAEVIHVPGFTYPVQTHFLDEDELSGLSLENTLNMSKNEGPTVVYEDVVKVLKYIHKNRPEGAILVFLPGWDDILKVKKLLPDANRSVQVLCLHSRMPDSEQKMIFHRFPPGVRKIILATNIAETSVTIDDVAYVVDCGIQKENRFDVERGINIIDNHWISKASSIQRKGRAGRVQAGEAFLLYPKQKFAQFLDYSIPEIQRTSLTKIVLDSKVYSNNMKASEFLGLLITPPEETAIDCAVDELVELELLDEAENLTPLGRVISDFQLEPKLAKAMVNSVIYKCVTPIVDIVTHFSAEMEVFSGGLSGKEQINKFKREFSSSSDHLSMMRLFEQWLDFVENDDQYEAESFCRRNNILDYKLRTLQQLRNIHFDYLHKGLHDCLPLSDDYSDSDELVKAVLLSGVGTVLQHRDHELVKGRLKKKNVLLTRHNHKATISSDSVNCRRAKFPTDFLVYINETRSNVRRMTVIRETSLITPLTLLLFKNNDIIIEEAKDVKTDNINEPVIVRLDGTKIAFITDRNQALLLQKCKEAITAGVEYYIYQLTKGAEYDREVNRVWDEILGKLNNCLKLEAQKIAF